MKLYPFLCQIFMEKKIFSTYSVIPTEIMLDKNISSTSKILYGIISSLCNEKGYCWASNDYLGELIGITGTRVSLIIKELVDFEYIESNVESNYKRKIMLMGVLTKVKGGVKEKLKGGLRKVKDNNIIEYYNNNIIPCEDKLRKDIQELLRLFYENLNPNIKFQNKTLRGDAEFLVKNYPLEKLEAMILYIKDNQGEQYFPNITTPTQLRDKMATIINYKNRNKKSAKIVKI